MVSVIIPTLNAEPLIDRLLSSLASQTVRCEVIVVDSASSDRTVSIAERRGAKTIVINRDDFDHGGTRTLAAKRSCGEILVFLTQDALPADECAIENLIKPLRNEEAAISYGRQLPDPQSSLFGGHLRLLNYPPRSSLRNAGDSKKYGLRTVFLSNSFAAYKRNALEEIGWFKENLILGEDSHAAAKLMARGLSVAYSADARVYHSHNYTPWQEFRRYFDTGVFHETEKWMLAEFGGPIKEGWLYVVSELGFALRRGKLLVVPEIILRNSLKYFGYRLGRKFNSLPGNVPMRLCMNKTWMKNNRRRK